MGLQVYNYLTRRHEPFVPVEEGSVGMYVCGPTVYDHAHLGHAKTYVAMDVVVRYLRYMGYKVRYVQNITDVGHLLDTGEDRILKGARRERIEPMEVVETYARSYFEDMDALGVLRPNISPRASCHIPEQIELVKKLLAAGFAYETEVGDVYFSVEKFTDYGKLSRRKVDELEAGVRVAVRDEKQHPADFALWKHAEPEHILRWPSPWGWGYPGWHVECSTMATKYLGDTFDIHGGGLENIFPHNECEIAQAEAGTGGGYARYWLLVGSLTVNGVKMSKSLGNFLTISDALRTHGPAAIRYLILSSHYRGPMDFSDEALDAATKGVTRLHNTVRLVRARLGTSTVSSSAGSGTIPNVDGCRRAFEEAMNDDFNTPQAIEQDALRAIDELYRELGGQVLGIIPDDLGEGVAEGVIDGLMDIVLSMRQQYRDEHQWDASDALRDRLAEYGILVEDRPDGATWRFEG
jgi:cysteinyl-tRNA synthetase